MTAKTKILATLGPASSSSDIIKKMIEAGIDGVRLNFSHGNKEFYKQLFNEITRATDDGKKPLAILVDLQGPKIRVGELIEPEVQLNTGGKIEITVEEIKGNRERISCSYKQLAEDAQTGDPVLIDDGIIRLRIIEKKEKSILCFIENGGVLKPKKGMNLPGMKLSTPSITEKDYADLEFLQGFRFDYIALSFVRSSDDIKELRSWLNKKNLDKPLIAKIEKREAVEKFDSILEEADGIMIARGDLGVELPPHEVPVLQKEIIKKCNSVGKPVITATQMLESMIENLIPTRAEASDVANAVWDGSDIVMLSGETSVGKHPVNTVRTMNDIIENAEQHAVSQGKVIFKIPEKVEDNLFDSVSNAISIISRQINASVIAALTGKGRTAKNLAKFRPKSIIAAFSDNPETINNLSLQWGVIPLFCDEIDKESQNNRTIDKAKKILLEQKLVKEGDVVIFTAGEPYSHKSRSNWLKFEVI
ncbi:MAG TPA: pyruvate kinase [Ignavibacteriaceae bacterium]|nr:pyruvate kinase [Ignavibacteriaceae bacterium]